MPPPQTEVLVTVAGMETARHVFAPGEYVLGRDAGCHIPIEADLVSQRHAKLTLNFDNALIEDLGSDGGTHINGKPIPKGGRTRLWPSQKIQVGAATIELRRLKADSDPDRTLAPTQEVVKRVLPEAFLREKKYDIGGVVAQGGMGAILDAKEATIERTVAMKVMLDSNAPDDLLRFLNEAKITGQLEHPNIVPVHELSVDENGQPFYTMKFVKGITLRKVLEKMAAGESAQSSVRSAQSSDSATKRDTEHCALNTEHFSLPVLLTIFQKVCDALAFAHSKGVIHRDLKPENIMVGDYGEVLLMDWGLAKRLRNTEPQGPEPVEGDIRTIRHSVAEEMPATAVFDPSALASTMAGAIMGTPQYMAPEQARGEIETLDQRADIYALGAILFHLLFLRPSVSGSDSMQIVGKVARGEIEWWNATSGRVSSQRSEASQTTAEEKRARRSRSNVPDSLLAVCRKALALDPAARYRSVEDLQADILAYQTGFATDAENASAWKQFTLLIKRHKAASIGLAAVLLVGITLGTKAIIEGKRAEREGARATIALDNLRRQAPALRQLVESEAGFQRFDSALDKLDAALALDPAHLPSYWRRAWLFIGMGRLADAVAAIRVAQLRDTSHGDWATILPVIEELAALQAGADWPVKPAQEIMKHLAKVGAAGETVSVSTRLKLPAAEKAKLVSKRLDEWLGKNKAIVRVDNAGLVEVILKGLPIDAIEPLRGLPIDKLDLDTTNVSNLEPLRGMPLIEIRLQQTKVADLSPLQGMPLQSIHLYGAKITDLAALRGAPLEHFSSYAVRVTDFSPLRGAPLRTVTIYNTGATDLSFLADAPLIYLHAQGTPIADLSPLAGKLLKTLYIARTNVRDLTPLRGAPIEELSIFITPQLKDLTPILDLPKLERLRVSKVGTIHERLRNHPSLKFIAYDDAPYRPVAEFWAEYDEQRAARKNLQEAREKNLAQVATALPALGMAKGKATIVEPWGIRLLLENLPVTDIRRLRPLPIDALSLFETKVADLAPLRGMRLKELSFAKTDVKDVSPLLDMPILEAAMVPQGATNLGVLRQHPTLKWLGWEGDWDKDANRPKLTTAEFWKRYDEQQAAHKK